MARIKIVERSIPKNKKIRAAEENVSKKKPKKEVNGTEKKTIKKQVNGIEKKLIKKEKGKRKEKKKEITLAPRLQLEPRLTPKQVPKELSKVKEKLNSVKKNEIEIFLPPVRHKDIKLPDMNNFEGHVNENITASNKDFAENDTKYETEQDLLDYVPYEPRRKGRPKKGLLNPKVWKDKELWNFAKGLQSYGFHETKKIAELVQTKTEKEVSLLLQRRCVEARHNNSNIKHETKGRPKNSWCKPSPAHLQNWPNVRKWKRMAFDQMLSLSRMKDYSRPVLLSLLTRFYNEAEEPSDPQVINVKNIYKYMLDCMLGEIPAQLGPKESALVLDMMKDLTVLPIVYQFEEEKNFLSKYTEATRYRPIQVKDEFKKRLHTENTDEKYDKNSVAVDEETFSILSQHKKLVQSFNPLAIPVWMLQSEQEIISKLI